jgi:hypothetical protein
MITITIDSIDRTNLVMFKSFKKTDKLNQLVDELMFDLRSHPDQTYKPSVGDEVIVTDDGTRIFGGVITTVDRSYEAMNLILHKVRCKDFTIYLERNLVAERYDSMTVDDIIDDIITNNASGFTTNNVNCPLTVETVLFNRVNVKDALQKLADLTGYSWYCDYNQDIHFIEKNAESAPYNLTDTSANYFFKSLILTDDFSQLRNSIYIRGGEATSSSSRTETFDGDGSKDTFALANKFAQKPTVTVGGVPQTVGLDFIDDDASYDCMWSFSGKYIRFTAGNTPASGTNNISASGFPLFPIQVQVQDPTSIATHGIYQHAIIDKTLKSREEAIRYGNAQLTAYANEIVEGSFDTDTQGLRSGQVININSATRGINEDYLIQRVVTKMKTPTVPTYEVELASLRTIGIIEFLIDLLTAGDRLIDDSEDQVLEEAYFFLETITVDEVFEVGVAIDNDETITVGESSTVQALNYGTQFVFGEWTPSGTKRVFILNGSPLG